MSIVSGYGTLYISLQTENHFNEWLWKHVYDRFPNGSIGGLNADEEQFMPYPKGIETELKPIAHWKTSQ